MQIDINDIIGIIELADTMADVESLKNDEPLSEQDVDSLDMANIFLMIEERYGIKINNEDSKDLNTVNAIVDFLRKK